MKNNYILTIAGSDILSGGGLQADLATFAVEGLHGFLALTATTAFIEDELTVFPSSTLHFAQQLENLHSVPFSAIKIGLLPTSEIASLTLEFIQEHPNIPVVLDPVMVFKENQDHQIHQMREQLLQFLPHISLVTPNLRETELLTQMKIQTMESMEHAARLLQQIGANQVVIKGGNRFSQTKAQDLFFDGQHIQLFSADLLSKNTNGAGCTFASSIASCLAKGSSPEEAVAYAKKFVHKAIAQSNEYGVVQYDSI